MEKYLDYQLSNLTFLLTYINEKSNSIVKSFYFSLNWLKKQKFESLLQINFFLCLVLYKDINLTHVKIDVSFDVCHYVIIFFYVKLSEGI